MLEGLSRTPKSLPCKYFYDEAGSRLFRQITELPEYYLTRCESEILRDNRRELAALLAGARFNLVELGAGDGRKTRVLLEQFIEDGLDFRYVPIDICEAAVRELIGNLKQSWSHLPCEGLAAEYFEGLRWLSERKEQRNLVLFLGSNIGNFSQAGMRVFLRNVREALNEGDLLLIGFDLIKDVPLIEKAYNDSPGITAQFNLNLLHRINRDLGGNFRTDRFRFLSRFDHSSGAVESYLISGRKQVVEVERLQRSFFFEDGEPIHTERSQKYLESEVVRLAQETGFTVVRQMKDQQGYFLDSLWEAGGGGEDGRGEKEDGRWKQKKRCLASDMGV